MVVLHTERKQAGAFYTPDDVARTLVRWAVREQTDHLLDPSCGEGSFLVCHRNVSGIERECPAAAIAHQRAPWANVHVGDFFAWAARSTRRFDCVVGNPPFIRYQRFSGELRKRAIGLCGGLGVKISALSSSWVPFLVVAASLLKPNGRLAFVVPAEIGHAPYAAPLISYLVRQFRRVQIIAIREKVFPRLSEDTWLLYAAGFAGSTDHVQLAECETFCPSDAPPERYSRVFLSDWERWHCRLRPFLLKEDARKLCERLAREPNTSFLGEIAKVGIGYVTGANDFFHLRPSTVRAARIPNRFLHPTVRKGRSLPPRTLTKRTVQAWLRRDQPILLLRLKAEEKLPASVVKYLDSPAGHRARASYKCRNRNPWYAVPDVRTPDAFLTYMNGRTPALVANACRCTCTNSVHAVQLVNGMRLSDLQAMWRHALARLSCELEGHPLGGGMLKIEPGEARRIVLPQSTLRLTKNESQRLADGRATMLRWRHYE